MATVKAHYAAAVKGTLENADALIALSDTPERRAKNQIVRDAAAEFFAALDRSNALGLKNENEGATKILLNEGGTARAKVRELVQARVERLTAELQEARDDAEAEAAASSLLISAAAIGLLGSIVLSGLIVVFGITRPISSLVRVMNWSAVFLPV